MRPIHFLTLALPALSASLACSGYSTGPAARVATAISVTLSATELETGQSGTATAVVVDQYGAPLDAGPVIWSSNFPAVAVVQPATGQILAVASGNAQIIAKFAGKEGHQAVTVSPPPILVNEVNTNGDSPGGWVELFNPLPEAVDMTGWTITSNDLDHSVSFAPGTIIPSGGHFVVEESSFPSGLNRTDGVHLFSRFAVESDGTSWSGGPLTTLGRCPDGQGAFHVTLAPSKGATNICP
ncbi:MAG TPA: lamin tail domain-containing protein [Gemmatimonadaceae bacterium]